MSEVRACPACDSRELEPFYELERLPVQSCVLLRERAEALAFPCAPLLLQFCGSCGFIFNSIFDPSLVDYGSETEESQHFSDTFNRFAEGLVEEIAGRYDLRDRRTLEIGCGKGEFLSALVQRTGTRGLGIDPGFRPGRLWGIDPKRLTFRKEHFDREAIDFPPDLVVCRHTLEHIQDVAAFVCDVGELVRRRPDAGTFFETPDAERILAEGAFWDIYYEHCSYFTRGSHARLFRRAELNVTELRLVYGDQYIVQFAEWGEGDALPQERDLARVHELVSAFPARVRERRAYWADLVRHHHAAGRRIALWGGGSKAVAFLASNGLGEEVAQVVDVNPFKQGKHLPGSGHRVIGPAALAAEPSDVVIVLNPIYAEEIGAILTDMAIDADLVTVSA